jgi:signal transduction histidine kinase
MMSRLSRTSRLSQDNVTNGVAINDAGDQAPEPRLTPVDGPLPIVSQVEALSAAAGAIVSLAAEGDLSPGNARQIATALADVLAIDIETACFGLVVRTATNAQTLALPPLAAIGIQLGLLVDLDLFTSVSLWRRTPEDTIETTLHAGEEHTGRRPRAEAQSILRGGTGRVRPDNGTVIASTPVMRYDRPVAALIGQAQHGTPERARLFLDETARAITPMLERELLLERSRSRERALSAGVERRLTRLAFDLHDGPIQDVLALGADVRYLQQQIEPFVSESHRELANGRFDDLTARLAELDRALREVSHSLESKSIMARPLGEILHRDVDAFAERTGIETSLELRGDPDSLDSAQRVTVFRGLQEALANVREHSGATRVSILIRARRGWIEVRITDNGSGFEVSRSLAQAAQRGRLGLVGIGERVRLLGGSFEIDSQPGGPTTLSFALPR